MSTPASLGVAQPTVGLKPPGRLVTRLATYAVSRGTTEALLGVRGIVLAMLLGPAAFGTWALLRLIMRYSGLAGHSVYRGLELELLQRPSSGTGVPADRPAATALGFVLLLAGAISGAALASSFAVDDPTDRLLLRGFAAASLAELLYGYAQVSTRVRGNLRSYSLLETGTTAVHVVAAVSLAWIWGLAGAFAGLTLANLIGIAAAARWVEFRPALRREPLLRLLKVGFPVVLTMCVGILLSTGDRWVVALWGGETMLGHYAFAGSLTTGAAALALVIRTVVFPEVYSQASSAGAATALHRHLERTLLPFACIVPPVLGLLSIAVGPLIALAMPQYVEAIAPARLFLLSGAAMGLVNLGSVGALASGQQRRLPGYALIALALTLGLSALALATGGALGAVAGASLAGHLVFAAQVLRLNVREAGLPDAHRFVLRTLVPLAWCAVSVAVSGAIFPGTDVESAGLMLLLYLGLLTALFPIWRQEWRRLRGN